MVKVAKPKLVIWDLDGTIIDSFGVYAAILKEAAELSGLSLPEEQELLRNFHGSLDESIKNAFDLVDGDAFSRLLNDFLRIQENYYENPEEHIFPDALDLVKRFSELGCKQVVATNRQHDGRGSASPRYLVSHSSLQAYIEDIVCGEEAPVRKPDPGVLANVAVARELRPQDMIVVGDQFVDAQLAQNLRCDAVIVNRSVEPLAHIDQLGNDPQFLTLVSSLDEVEVA